MEELQLADPEEGTDRPVENLAWHSGMDNSSQMQAEGERELLSKQCSSYCIIQASWVLNGGSKMMIYCDKLIILCSCMVSPPPLFWEEVWFS